MHKIKKIILFVWAIGLFCACSNSANSENDQPNLSTELGSKIGVWEGVGEQPGISWTIKITLKADEQLIEYPSLGCGGHFDLLIEDDGYLLFRENITFGGGCADQGFVELVELTPTKMEFNYYWPDENNGKGDLGAFGEVTK